MDGGMQPLECMRRKMCDPVVSSDGATKGPEFESLEVVLSEQTDSDYNNPT